MRRPLQWRIPIAGYGNRMRAFAPGIFDGGDRERRPSAGGDSYDDVVPARFSLLHFTHAEFAGIFVRLDRRGQGRGAAGHDELHCPGIHVERGWTFGRIEGRNASAGARADIDQSAAALQSVRNQSDGACDLGKGTPHCIHYHGVLGVDDADYFQRRLQIQVRRSAVGLLGGKPAQVLPSSYSLAASKRFLQRFHHGILKCRAHVLDRFVAAIGPGPVGEQSDGKLALGIDPQRGTGVAQMSEGTGREIFS